MKKTIAAKKEHNWHTEQGPRDALPEQERRGIYHITFSCKHMREKKVKRGGESWGIILGLLRAFLVGSMESVRSKSGKKLEWTVVTNKEQLLSAQLCFSRVFKVSESSHFKPDYNRGT